ncbi:hypothetical protein MF4642_15175 [Acinetobacter sp. MF4642]|nr:hypothetical protein MF4642_15175 [Acinetobacter sp. MF4642]
MIMIQCVSEPLKVKNRKVETVLSHFFVVVGDWRIWEVFNSSIIFNEKSQSDRLAFLRRLDLT